MRGMSKDVRRCGSMTRMRCAIGLRVERSRPYIDLPCFDLVVELFNLFVDPFVLFVQIL